MLIKGCNKAIKTFSVTNFPAAEIRLQRPEGFNKGVTNFPAAR